MEALTITQAEKYTGYSRITWQKWLSSGAVPGNKGDGRTEPWVIPAGEVERIRQQRVQELKEQLAKIDKPVPGTNSATPAPTPNE